MPNQEVNPPRKGVGLIVSCMSNRELSQIFYDLEQVKAGLLTESEGLERLVKKYSASFSNESPDPEKVFCACAEAFTKAITYELARRFHNEQAERRRVLRVFLIEEDEPITVVIPEDVNVDIDDSFEVYDYLERYIKKDIDYWQILSEV